MNKLIPAGVTGRVVKAEPLVGVDRDEIVALVGRIKRADEKAQAAYMPGSNAKVVKAEDAAWADEWQLPREVLDYFEIEKAA